MTPLRPPVRPLAVPGAEHVVRWQPDEWMFRVFHAHPDPARAPLRARIFGPVARFDPHARDRHQRPKVQADGRGVQYLGDSLGCGLAEALPEQWPEVRICAEPPGGAGRADPSAAAAGSAGRRRDGDRRGGHARRGQRAAPAHPALGARDLRGPARARGRGLSRRAPGRRVGRRVGPRRRPAGPAGHARRRRATRRSAAALPRRRRIGAAGPEPRVGRGLPRVRRPSAAAAPA